MKIGFTAFPIAFQKKGGLEVQIRETAGALRDLGYDVEIVELTRQKLWDFDLIHHFSLNHGSERFIRLAKANNVPCVVTPLAPHIDGWFKAQTVRIVPQLLHRVFGWEFRNRWDDIRDGLKESDAILPLTETERRSIARVFPEVAGKMTVVPNGITEAFFNADPALFRSEYPKLERFVVAASNFVPYKNQLGLIQAAKKAGYHTVLVGSISEQAYFDRCMEEGGDDVTYIGELDYPSEMLTSLFAAADLVALVSYIEPFGLVPFEALAAGTPSLLTTASGVTWASEPPYFQRVDPDDEGQIRAAIERAMAAPRDRAACRNLVADMHWSNVARQIADIYRSVTAA